MCWLKLHLTDFDQFFLPPIHLNNENSARDDHREDWVQKTRRLTSF